jgi:hypothetical protein
LKIGELAFQLIRSDMNQREHSRRMPVFKLNPTREEQGFAPGDRLTERSSRQKDISNVIREFLDNMP